MKLPKPISLRRTYRVSKQKQLITVLFRAAMRELKITDREVMRRVYDKIKGKNYGYKQLVEFIKEVQKL